MRRGTCSAWDPVGDQQTGALAKVSEGDKGKKLEVTGRDREGTGRAVDQSVPSPTSPLSSP